MRRRTSSNGGVSCGRPPWRAAGVFVPLTLLDLCLARVRRLTTLEEDLWEGVAAGRYPACLHDRLDHFKRTRHARVPYDMVPVSAVPKELIRLPPAFKVHPAKLTRPSIKFSVDLVQGMKDYLRVLVAIAGLTHTSMSASIERYSRHLVRAAAKQKNGQDRYGSPDLHVEMVWLAHLIRTKDYREICHLNFGTIVDHDLSSTLALIPKEKGKMEDMEDNDEAAWRRVPVKRGEWTNASAMGIEIKPSVIIEDQQWLTDFCKDASSARARWQRESSQSSVALLNDQHDEQADPRKRRAEIVEWFCERLLDEQYMQPCLAERILLGYQRMIYLCARYPYRIKEFHPPLLVDLVWHVHQVHPVAYLHDIQQLAGFVVEHRPWPMPAQPGHIHARSLGLWCEEFTEEQYFECELAERRSRHPL